VQLSLFHSRYTDQINFNLFCRNALDDEDESTLEQEVEIMSTLDHPNIVRLYELFDEDNIMYLVMEIMKGGELFDRIVEKESYTEKEACETIRPLVDAIRYCHE
jgi:calcium/calmodulin-dependent protein kinase I